MKKILFIFFMFLLNIFLELANAQEIQIPIDVEGKIEYIDSKLEQKLNLFTGYANFRAARLFQISNTVFMLEIYYRPQEKLLKERLQFSLEEVTSFKQKVTNRIKQKAPQVAFDQSGRTKLMIGNTALSLGFYGWALPSALGLDDSSKLHVALYMITNSAGFFFPFSATKNIPVTKAASILSFYGGTRGIMHGIALAYLFSKEPSDRLISGAGMLVSIPEAISGFVIAGRSNMSAGTAEVIGVGGDFGIGLGLGAAHLANFYEDNEQSAAAVTLLGSGIGLLGGNLLASHQHYTRGDGHVLSAFGLLGGYIPLALVDNISPKKDRAYSASSMVGAIIGIGLGHRLLRGKDFSTDQGNLIRLSTLAGGLFGLGIAYLVSSDNAGSNALSDNSALYLTASAIGATGGFWLLYRSYAGKAQKSQNSFLGNIRIMPEGLIALAMGNKMNYAQKAIPFIKFKYKF